MNLKLWTLLPWAQIVSESMILIMEIEPRSIKSRRATNSSRFVDRVLEALFVIYSVPP